MHFGREQSLNIPMYFLKTCLLPPCRNGHVGRACNVDDQTTVKNEAARWTVCSRCGHGPRKWQRPGKRSWWMHMAEPPAFASWYWRTRAWRNSCFPLMCWKQMMSLLPISRLKKLYFLKSFFEEVGDPLSLLVFHVTHRRQHSELLAPAFLPNNLVVFQVVEVRPASNVSVQEHEEHFSDFRYWDLPETVTDWIDQII